MTQGTPDTNISTEHQKEGDALRPSDTLDRGQANEEDEGAPQARPGADPAFGRSTIDTPHPDDKLSREEPSK
jgi:hypothetical protein